MLAGTRAAQVAWLNVRLTLEFIDASRRSIDGDLLSALLVAGVSIANIEATQLHPGDLDRYPTPSDLPDDQRRPVNAVSIALSLGIPRETARRKLADLVNRGVLTRKGDGIFLSSAVILSEPFMMAIASYLSATSRFVSGLSVLEACGVLGTDRMANPPWSIGGITTRLMTAHVLRGIESATDLNPSVSLSTQYIALALAHLTGAALRVQPGLPEGAGRLAYLAPTFKAVSVSRLSRFTRLPHETVRRQILKLEKMGAVTQRDGGKVIDLSDPARMIPWVDLQTQTDVSTRQTVWKLFRAGVIVHTPPSETPLHPLMP